MKKWFCSTVRNVTVNVLDECEDLERNGYKVEQIVFVENQYKIF